MLKGKNDSNTYTTMWCSRPQTERSPCMSWNWLKCNKCTRFFVFLFLCSLNKSELEVWPAILLPNTQRWKIAISHSVSSDCTGYSGSKIYWNAINLKNMVKISWKLDRNLVEKANKHACFVHACAESIISNWIRFLFQSVQVFFFNRTILKQQAIP